MVGRQVLALKIGVRIPAPEQIKFIKKFQIFWNIID